MSYPITAGDVFEAIQAGAREATLQMLKDVDFSTAQGQAQAKALLEQIEGKDFATQTTLAQILTKLADPATQTTLAAVLSKLETVSDTLTDGTQKTTLTGQLPKPTPMRMVGDVYEPTPPGFTGIAMILGLPLYWEYKYDVPARQVAVDSTGRVFVAYNSGWVAGFDRGGTMLWINRNPQTSDVRGITCSEEFVYVINANGYLYQRDSATGDIVSEVRNPSNRGYSVIYHNAALYVTDYRSGVFKYTDDLEDIEWEWVTDYSTDDIAIGPDNSLYVSGDNKLSRLSIVDGAEEWTVGTGLARGYSLVVTSDSVYVSNSMGSGVLLKTDLDGQEVWRKSFSHSLQTIAADSSGNVYVTSRDSLFRKISPDGDVVWELKYATDRTNGVAVDSEDNVYMTSFDGGIYALAGDMQVKGYRVIYDA